MTGRFSFSAISPEELKTISREATSDHMQNGTDLTDAVVKAASLFNRPLTSEHVRRVCEMTYHDTFERKFRDSEGPDRYVSFDPPVAVDAASRLHADKVASVRMKKAPAMMSSALEKSASMTSPTRRRFQPVNAFDELVKQAGTDNGVLWYNPLSELCHIRDHLKEAMASLKTEKATAADSEKWAMMELLGHAVQMYKEGVATDGILHACAASVGEETPPFVTSELVGELAFEMGNHGCSLEPDKTASYGLVNPRHPLAQTFSKVAGFRSQRVHTEYALQELQSEWDRVNGELRALCE